jgi:hypothetical protein
LKSELFQNLNDDHFSPIALKLNFGRFRAGSPHYAALKCRDAIWMFEGKSSDSSPLWHLKNLKQIEYCAETTANTSKATVATQCAQERGKR